ncbi:MAG: hypothetical protein ABIH09_05020 [Candidatus Omnitrophota bacterium]
MDVELKGIIDKIKEEGVDAAGKEAEDIIKTAETRANTLIINAEKERENILNKAKEEAIRVQQTGQDSVRHAARDVLLSLRENIIGLFDKVMKEEISGQFSPELLKDAIGAIVENFCKEKSTELEVVLNEKDKETIQKYFLSKLKNKMAQKVEIKVSPNVKSGFLIGKKGKNSYYDFTDDAVTEAFKNFLNPKLTDILKLNK